MLNFILGDLMFVSMGSEPTESAWAFVKPNAIQAAAIMSFGEFVSCMLTCQCCKTPIRAEAIIDIH